MAALPFLIGGASAGLSYMGEKKAEDARNSTFNAERDRQNALTADQTAQFQDSLNKTKTLFDPAAQAQAVASREGVLDRASAPSPTAGSYLPGSSSAPSIVATATDKAAAGSRATSSQLAHAIATLGGGGDQKLGLDTAIGHNSSNIGQIASFKAGSAGVLDAEMRAAAHKGEALRGLGSFIHQIGMAALTGGAGGGAGAGASGADSVAGYGGLPGIY